MYSTYSSILLVFKTYSHLTMKKYSLSVLLLFVTLLIATPHADAASYAFDNFNLEEVKDSGDTQKASKEVSEGFRLSKSGKQEQAFKMFTLAAKRNELTAYMALGIMHREGRGTPENLKLAKENFQKAAAKGNPQATKELVLLRFAAPDGPEEFAAARKQMEQLASKGLAVAQLRLGLAHLAGYGYTADATKAIEYLTQATKSTGSFKSDAAFVLGQLYRDGQLKPELKPDPLSAESWLKKAAEAKHLGAMRALGEFYLASNPAQQNYAKVRD